MKKGVLAFVFFSFGFAAQGAQAEVIVDCRHESGAANGGERLQVTIERLPNDSYFYTAVRCMRFHGDGCIEGGNAYESSGQIEREDDDEGTRFQFKFKNAQVAFGRQRFEAGLFIDTKYGTELRFEAGECVFLYE